MSGNFGMTNSLKKNVLTIYLDGEDGVAARCCVSLAYQNLTLYESVRGIVHVELIRKHLNSRNREEVNRAGLIAKSKWRVTRDLC